MGFKIVCRTPDDLMWRTELLYKYSICMYMYDITWHNQAERGVKWDTTANLYDFCMGLIWCHTRTWSTLYQSLSTFTMSSVGCPSPTSLFKVEHSDSQDTAVVTLAHHIWEDLVDTCWHQSEPAFLTSKELKLMKLDILLKLYDQTNVVHCKECASWMSQSQDPALCCSINFKFLVRVASGICGGTEPIKSNWTCSRSLQLGLVCVFERANQSCFQKIFGHLWTMVACNPLITQLPTERWRTSHIYNYCDHPCICSSSGQQITSTFCWQHSLFHCTQVANMFMPYSLLPVPKCPSALSSHVPRKLTQIYQRQTRQVHMIQMHNN